MLPNLAALRVSDDTTGAPKRARADEDAPPPSAAESAFFSADVAGAVALAAVAGSEDCKALNKLIATLNLAAGRDIGREVVTNPLLWYAACAEFDFPPLDPKVVPTPTQAPEAMGYAYWQQRFRDRCEQFHLALHIARERFSRLDHLQARYVVQDIIRELRANANGLDWVRQNERWIRVAMRDIDPVMLIASNLKTLRTNKELILKALETSDAPLEVLPEAHRRALLLDDDVFVAAVKHNVAYLYPLHDMAARPDVPLGGYDRAMSLRLLGANPRVLGYLNERYTNDPRFIMEALQLKVGILDELASSLPAAVFRDVEFVRFAVENDANYLRYASAALKDDSAVFEAAFAQSSDAFAHASERIRSDRAVAMRAVSLNGDLLQYASDPLRGDRDVVETAMRTRPSAVQHATTEFLEANFDLVERAYALEPNPRWTLTYARLRDAAPPGTWYDRDFALAVVKRLPVVYALLSDALKSDIAIARAAYESPSVRATIPGNLRVLIEQKRLPPAFG